METTSKIIKRNAQIKQYCDRTIHALQEVKDCVDIGNNAVFMTIVQRCIKDLQTVLRLLYFKV